MGNDARVNVAEMLGASKDEITFTSGGTESNHLAIWSALALYKSRSKVKDDKCPGGGSKLPCHPSSQGLPHIVTTNVEHCAIELPLRRLEEEGVVRVTRVPVVPGAGRVTVPAVLEAIEQDTCLVTIMMANNETGVLQPVGEVFRALKDRPHATLVPPLLHTDAAQAVGKVPVKVDLLCVDMITIAGHKFYGPRVGALYHRKGVAVTPMLYGGDQEAGLRPGTENTPMLVGLGAAARLVTANLSEYTEHMAEMRNYLREQLIRKFQLVSGEDGGPLKAGEVCWRMVDQVTLPNTLSVRFGGCTGPQLLQKCQGEIEASCGAACHSAGPVSAVLLASFRWDEDGARETVRLSVGRDTTKHLIDKAVDALAAAVMC